MTGYGAPFETFGKFMAEWSWRNTAIAKYEVFYGDESKANEGKGLDPERCAQSGFGLTICEVRARPCANQTELECKPDDRQNCDPKIKSIQSQLADNGFPVGAIDGIRGKKFEQALKDFQKKFKNDNKVADLSALHDEIEALNK